MRAPPNDPTPSSGRRRAVRQSPLRPYSQTVFAVAKSRSQSGRGGNCDARGRAQTSGVAIVRVPCPAGDKALTLPRLIRAGSPGAARPPGSGGPGPPRSETSTRECSVKRLGFANLESPSGQNARLPAGIEKETEGVTLVSTRHSAPQFPLHPYTVRRLSSSLSPTARSSPLTPGTSQPSRVATGRGNSGYAGSGSAALVRNAGDGVRAPCPSAPRGSRPPRASS
jgi:hypothetical protein